MAVAHIAYIHPGMLENHPGLVITEDTQDRLDFLHRTQWDLLVGAVSLVCSGTAFRETNVATESETTNGWFAITADIYSENRAQTERQVAGTKADIDEVGLAQKDFIRINEGLALPNRYQGLLVRAARTLGFRQPAGVLAVGPVLIESNAYTSCPVKRDALPEQTEYSYGTADNFALLRQE